MHKTKQLLRSAWAGLSVQARETGRWLGSIPRIAHEHLKVLGGIRWMFVGLLIFDLLVVGMNIYLGNDLWGPILPIIALPFVIRMLVHARLQEFDSVHRILLHTLPEEDWLQRNWEGMDNETAHRSFLRLARKTWTSLYLHRISQSHPGVLRDNYLHYLIDGTLLHHSVMTIKCELSPRHSVKSILVRSKEIDVNDRKAIRSNIRDRGDASEKEIAFANILETHMDIHCGYALALLSYINHPVHGVRDPWNWDNLLASLRRHTYTLMDERPGSDSRKDDFLALRVIHASCMVAAQKNLSMDELLALVELDPDHSYQYVSGFYEYILRITRRALLSAVTGRDKVISDDLELAAGNLENDGFMRNASRLYFGNPDISLFTNSPDEWLGAMKRPEMNLSPSNARALLMRKRM